MVYPRQPLMPRLLARRSIEGECWVYTGNVTADGYGHISMNGTVQPVHRLAYKELVGPIPDGLVIDHLCRNRACFNPDHLEPVTQQENVLRGVGEMSRFARRDQCDNGHPFDATNTAIRKDGGRKCRTCHREYMRAYRARKGQ